MDGTRVPNRISFSETEEFERSGFIGRIIVPKEAQTGFSINLVDCFDDHPVKRVGEGTTRIYFVILGKGKFTVNNVTYVAIKNDTFVINPGETYSYFGAMKLIEFNVSPDNSFKDERI